MHRKQSQKSNPSQGTEMALIPFSELTLQQELGRGNFGVVYAALRLGKSKPEPIAVKKLLDPLDAGQVDALKKEISRYTRLRHPNLIQLLGLCLESPCAFIVMELVTTGSLFERVQSTIGLPWSQRLSMALDIASGILHLHDQGIFHQNLKSSNILIDEYFHAKIANFGLTKIKKFSPSFDVAQNQISTIPWKAPELFSRGRYDKKAIDIYAIGIIFWEIATGKHPYEAFTSLQEIIQQVRRGKREIIPGDVPTGFPTLIERAWADDPKDRPSVQAMHRDMLDIYDGQTITETKKEASRLRNACRYEEALEKYHDAQKFLTTLIARLGDIPENTKKIFDNAVLQVELLFDTGLTLFEQGEVDKSLEKYNEVREKLCRLESDPSHEPIIDILLFKMNLMMSVIYADKNQLELAKTFFALIKTESLETFGQEHQGQYRLLHARLINDSDPVAAEADYFQAITHFRHAKKDFPSLGAHRRYADALFNLARHLERHNDQLGQRSFAISYAKEAASVSRENNGLEHPITCRYLLECARLLEQHFLVSNNRKTLVEAIDYLQKVYQINSQILTNSSHTFHSFDLLEHHALVKRLAQWHAWSDDLLQAAELYENEANILKGKFPIEQLTCLEHAAHYYALSDHSTRHPGYARVLTEKAAVLFAAPLSDPMAALAALREARECEDSEERRQLLASYEATCQDFFRGWEGMHLIQWLWCLEQYRDFQQQGLREATHPDDFFHWKQATLEFPPKRKVQLMMLLTRLHSLLDQSYSDFIIKQKKAGTVEKIKHSATPAQNEEKINENNELENKVYESAEEKDESNQQVSTEAGTAVKHYFPMHGSIENLSQEWNNKGVTWKTPFHPIRDALLQVQPFATLDPAYPRRANWLFPLYSIANYLKHVHLGVQVLSKDPITSRQGLLQRRFQGIELGVSRMSSAVYSFSFIELTNDQEVSHQLFECLKSSALLYLKKNDNTYYVALTEPLVNAYFISNNEEDARAAVDAYATLLQLKISERLPQLTFEKIRSVAAYLLNLAAQSQGLEDTTQRLSATEFIASIFEGILFLLQTFSSAFTTAPLNVENFINSVYRQPFSLTALEERFKQLTSDPTSSLYDYNLIATSLIQAYALINERQKQERLMAMIKEKRIPVWLRKKYNTLLFLTHHQAPVSARSSCMDDDLLARLSFVEQSIDDLLYFIFNNNEHDRNIARNIAAGVYLQLHFILDQIFQRYFSRILGTVFLKHYPENQNALNELSQQLEKEGKPIHSDIKKVISDSLTGIDLCLMSEIGEKGPEPSKVYLIIEGNCIKYRTHLTKDNNFVRLGEEISQQNGELYQAISENTLKSISQQCKENLLEIISKKRHAPLKWWPPFREKSLRIKHASFQDPCDLFPPNVNVTKGLEKKLKLEFQDSLDGVKKIVACFLAELEQLPALPRVYTHFTPIPEVPVSTPKLYSHAPAIGSAGASYAFGPTQVTSAFSVRSTLNSSISRESVPNNPEPTVFTRNERAVSASSPTGKEYYELATAAEKAEKKAGTKNLHQAYDYFCRSSNKDYPKSWARLGLFAIKGEGVCEIDKETAQHYFERGIASGHSPAMFHLARMFEKGDIPSAIANIDQALLWYERTRKTDPTFPGCEEKIATLTEQRRAS